MKKTRQVPRIKVYKEGVYLAEVGGAGGDSDVNSV